MVSVIFPAAGQGKRMQAGLNKVLLEIAEQPVLVRTLKRFSQVPAVGQLVVVVGAAEVSFVKRILQHIDGLKPWTVTAGGSERQYSIANGLKVVAPEADLILVHDAARPLVRLETIERVIAAAGKYGAAIAAVKAKNTIKEAAPNGVVSSTPDRAKLWEVQTPQGFKREVLFAAYEMAKKTGFLGTDDASLVEKNGHEVHLVEGEYSNIKITTPEDLLIAETLLRFEQAKGIKGTLHEQLDKAADKAKQLIHRHMLG